MRNNLMVLIATLILSAPARPLALSSAGFHGGGDFRGGGFHGGGFAGGFHNHGFAPRFGTGGVFLGNGITPGPACFYDVYGNLVDQFGNPCDY